MNKDMNAQKKPVDQNRAGAVSVNVFENTNKDSSGKEFTTKSFVVQRAYTKDEGKTWEHTNSFKLNDVPKLIAMLAAAYAKAIATSREE